MKSKFTASKTNDPWITTFIFCYVYQIPTDLNLGNDRTHKLMLLSFLIGPVGKLMLELNSGDIGKRIIRGLEENLSQPLTFCTGPWGTKSAIS